MSAIDSVYVRLVAPAMFAPSRCHWYVYVLPMPLHVPVFPVSVDPRRAVPLTAGRTVLTGRALGTAIVALLAAATVPSGFVAVTTTRIAAPTSPAVSV